MRISLAFESNESINLPISYNHMLQSLIFKIVSKKLPGFHDGGPCLNNRQFRPFVFSRIKGKHVIHNNQIKFDPPISFSVASPYDEIIQVIGNQFLKSEELDIIGRKLKLVRIEVRDQKVKESPVKVITLSPITIRSTLITPEGKRKSYYYNPFEKDFEAQIKANLLRKAKAIGLELLSNEFSIKPIGKMKQRIIKYKGFIIIAWDGRFEVLGNTELIKLAFNWGLGSKNAQGFGMIKILKGGEQS